MPLLESVILLLGTGCYVAALVLTVVRLFNRRAPLRGINFILILSGWLLQTAGLWIVGMTVGACPVRNPFQVFQFISWSIVLVYLFTGQVFRLSLFGTASASLAALIGLAAYLVPGDIYSGPMSPLGGHPRVEAHAAIALLSYGIFGLLAVLSALYLLQNYGLKKKRYPGIFRFLPPIMEMDTVLFRLLMMACGAFTVSVAIGALYWLEHPDQVTVLKLAFTVTLWLAYLLVLALRSFNRLFGTRLAWTCILLMAAALITLWPVEAGRDHGDPLSRLLQHDTPDHGD